MKILNNGSLANQMLSPHLIEVSLDSLKNRLMGHINCLSSKSMNIILYGILSPESVEKTLQMIINDTDNFSKPLNAKYDNIEVIIYYHQEGKKKTTITSLIPLIYLIRNCGIYFYCSNT